MKKAFLALALLCLSWFQTTEAIDVMLEGKAAWFHPTGRKFQKIYGNGGLYGGEITLFPFCNGLGFRNWQWLENLGVFVSADSYSRRGRSLQSCGPDVGSSRTRISLVPVAFGAKYLFPVSCFCDCSFVDLYVGAGVQWNIIHVRDHNRFVKRSINKTEVGGVYKFGAIVRLPCEWFLDVFINYSDKIAHHRGSHDKRVIPRNADISALIVGAGIGYNFNFDSICNCF